MSPFEICQLIILETDQICAQLLSVRYTQMHNTNLRIKMPVIWPVLQHINSLTGFLIVCYPELVFLMEERTQCTTCIITTLKYKSKQSVYYTRRNYSNLSACVYLNLLSPTRFLSCMTHSTTGCTTNLLQLLE